MNLSKTKLTQKQKEFVSQSRKQIQDILSQKEERIILFVGPCSIHNYDEAIEYATKIKELSQVVKDKFFLVMRVYVEKPRTTIGWKGFMIDPDLDNSQDVKKGIQKTQQLFSHITDLEVPIATEFLHPFFGHFTKDFVSWGCIGARTVESQSHRELASSFTFPVGFKNTTNGNIELAANAIVSAKEKHTILIPQNDGKFIIEKSLGNTKTHIVLRGGIKPNYDELSISQAAEFSQKAKGLSGIVIDCSHANSQKDYMKQPFVFETLIQLVKNTDLPIKGIMLESYLNEGNQKISSKLKPGISITDSCISWNTTKKLILQAYEKF